LDNKIYGIRPVIEAIKSGKEIEKVLISKDLRGILYQELFSLIKDNNTSYQFVPVEKINHLSKKNNQGVIALISEISYTNIEQLIPLIYEQGKVPAVLILDRITDVRNIGAIVRTAECAGIDAIIVPEKGSAQINSDAIKTSAGALHSFPVCRSSNLKRTIKFLKDSGLKILSASESSETLYYDADFTVPVAIILGSEQDGISPEILKLSDEIVRIPLFGSIESLNVSVSAGVIIYETVRQRNLILY
jgi:23S rRNA (guanosine2251-2'-O)-methyltransferase